MNNHLHHVHVFASDLDESVKFYEEVFGGEIVLDMKLAGARNVFMRIGNGRVHFYDQPPKFSGRGSIHHFGVQTDDIEGMIEKLKSRDIALSKGVVDLGSWKYIMVPAPDDVLIELFEINKNEVPESLCDYFE